MNQNFTAALDELETQLGAMARTVRGLRAQLERAGAVPMTTVAGGHLTLHEAMAVVLRQRGNEWTKISELAEMVNGQQLYEKRDGTPVEPNQLHARANRPTYRKMFEKRGPMLRLRVPTEAAR